MAKQTISTSYVPCNPFLFFFLLSGVQHRILNNNINDNNNNNNNNNNDSNNNSNNNNNSNTDTSNNNNTGTDNDNTNDNERGEWKIMLKMYIKSIFKF